MFLGRFPQSLGSICFPRVRGDVPSGQPTSDRALPFSPRARGCSSYGIDYVDVTAVFPACAGMFQVCVEGGDNRCSFPRVRGDVPDKELRQVVNALFSPRARGCSYAET